MNPILCKQSNPPFNIYLYKRNMDILIQCIYSDENKYSAVFNLEKLKNIDILFNGFPPLSLTDIYDILFKYFSENNASIKEVSNSRIIIEIEKDVKPNMIFELKRDKINDINDSQKIVNANNDMDYQIININDNDNENLMNNINSSNYSNYTNKMINKKINNVNNNTIFFIENMNNDNMNNNGIMNNNQTSQVFNENLNYKDNTNFNGNKFNNMNFKNNNENINYNNKNHFNNIISNYNNDLNIEKLNENGENQKDSKVYGGLSDDINDNFNNNIIFDNKNNSPFHNFNKYNNNHLNKNQNQINSSINIRLGQPKNNQNGELKKDLNCFLKFLLLKKLTNKIENIFQYENLKNVEEVIKLIKKNKDFKDDINWQNKNNILSYLKYLNNKDLDKNYLLEKLFAEKKEVRNDIFNYWKYLSIYEGYNNNFEHKFYEDIRNSYLDYSLVSMNILERDNPEEYMHKKKECKNMKTMKLYFLSEINYDSNKLNMKLEYSNKSTYGRGFYFSDSIDYIAKCQNNESIPKIGEYFSLIICEIFYDEEKLKEYDKNLSLSDSNQNNSSKDKEKVEPNGLIKIEIFQLNDSNNSKRKICNEYVLSEKYQILPLYTFTLRRNEYFVVFRDPNFIKKNHYSRDLKDIILRSLKFSNNMNFYFESSTEEALKLILQKKKKEKVILITSIGRDRSGKRFVEIARRILQSDDLIVLFFSNNTNNLDWIEGFSNCLYSSDPNIYEEYISNYNNVGLKELKIKVENLQNIQLKEFSFNFLSYSHCDDDLSFSCFDYIRCIYFRSVYILNPEKSLYLSMTKEGKVKKSEEECLWMITLNDNDITLFSNGYYLDIDENKEIAKGSKEMKKWKFSKDNNDYYFNYNEEGKNGYLSMEDDEDIRVNKEALAENSTFRLNDINN